MPQLVYPCFTAAWEPKTVIFSCIVCSYFVSVSYVYHGVVRIPDLQSLSSYQVKKWTSYLTKWMVWINALQWFLGKKPCDMI